MAALCEGVCARREHVWTGAQCQPRTQWQQMGPCSGRCRQAGGRRVLVGGGSCNQALGPARAHAKDGDLFPWLVTPAGAGAGAGAGRRKMQAHARRRQVQAQRARARVRRRRGQAPPTCVLCRSRPSCCFRVSMSISARLASLDRGMLCRQGRWGGVQQRKGGSGAGAGGTQGRQVAGNWGRHGRARGARTPPTGCPAFATIATTSQPRRSRCRA